MSSRQSRREAVAVQEERKRRSGVFGLSLHILFVLFVSLALPRIGQTSATWGLMTYPPPVVLIGVSGVFFLFALFAKVRTRLLHFFVLLASVIFIGGFRYPIKVDAEREDYRIMTLNTLGGKVETDKLAEIIKSENIDIIFLQETSTTEGMYGKILHQEFKNWYLAERGESAILSKHELANIKEIPVIVGNFKRYLIQADLAGPRPMRLLSVHWPVPQFLGSPKEVIDRLEEGQSWMEVYLQETKRVADETTIPLVIGGDFNTPPLHYFYREMDENLTNTYQVSGKGFGYTFRGDIPVTRIDHIWINDELMAKETKVIKVPGTDHYGVIAKLQYEDKLYLPTPKTQTNNQ